jgi:hypothetical protein
MTWDELEELQDRLTTILEYERAEEGFSPSRRIIISSIGRQPGEPSTTSTQTTPATGTATKPSRQFTIP